MRAFARTLSKLIVALVAIPVLWMVIIGLLPRRVFYKDRQPTRMGRFTNRLVALWSRYGGPPAWNVELRTRGPRTGRENRVPIVIGRLDGVDYAVSMLGQGSRWVRNLRAGDGSAIIRHGRSRPVRLVEVTDNAERARAIKAYLRRAIGARPHISIAPDAPIEGFERIAGDYPVFRVLDTPEAPVGMVPAETPGAHD
jgi:hypothetical protein